MVYKVASFTDGGDIVLNNGMVIDQRYGHIAHGFATTSMSAQGRTTDRVVVSQSSQAKRTASREQLYVSASRGRYEIRMFVDDAQQVRNNVMRSEAEMSATELLEKPEHDAAKSRLREHAELVMRLARRAKRYAGTKIRETFVDRYARQPREAATEKAEQEKQRDGPKR